MFRQLGPILLLGSALEATWLAIVSLGPLRDRTESFLALILTAFALCIWSYFRAPIRDRRGVLAVLALALVFRLTLWPAEPSQSEDVYRYVWDARVASAGASPFRLPPQDPQFEALRHDGLYARLNSKEYVSVYPPFLQALFRGTRALFGDNAVAMKTLFGVIEFLSLILIWKLLVLWNVRLEGLYLTAWNPLFVFEFSHSGHADSVVVFLLLLSALMLHYAWKAGAAMSWAGAVLSKLHPALLFPLLWRATGPVPMIAACAVSLGFTLAYLPLSLWRDYVDALLPFFRTFEFNSGIFTLLQSLPGESRWKANLGLYQTVLLLVIVAVLSLRFPLRRPADLLHAAFWIMTADLCLSRVVHPWYLSWAAFALPFFPYAFMVYWTGAGLLSYMAYAYRPPFMPAWVLLAEYVPVFLLMIWEIRRGRPLLALARTDAANAGSRTVEAAAQ